MSEELFDIRDLEYFKNKNIFSGSAGEYKYKIIPDGEVFKVHAWTGDGCFDKSENTLQAEFPFDDDGLVNVVNWIKEQHKNLL